MRGRRINLASGAAGHPERRDPLTGRHPVEAFGEAQHTGAGEPVEDLLAAALIGDHPGVAQHRQVARRGGRGAAGHLRQLTRTDRPVGERVDDRHPAVMPECLEHFGLVLEGGSGWSVALGHAAIIRLLAKYATEKRRGVVISSVVGRHLRGLRRCGGVLRAG